ncbi:MAG: hypothetical protein ABI340_03190 [Nitrososphaera sp.]|jgi:hypothetical protein
MLNRIRRELGLAGTGIADFLDGFENINSWKYDTTPTDLVEWSEQLRWIKGEKFTFKDRDYLFQIYRDQNKEIRIVKPRQIEITEFALNWLVYHLTKNPFTVGLYASDRKDHVSKFSGLRLKSQCLNQSPILKDMTKTGNVGMQPFKNDSILYMLSAWDNFESARSIPVDFAVVDEMQSVNVEALPVLKEALSKSRFRKILEIGTGSDEGDNWYKEWHVVLFMSGIYNKRIGSCDQRLFQEFLHIT